MRVLVVGTGGREHALAWAIRRSPEVKELYATAGNPGIERIARPVPIGPLEVEKLAAWAADERIDLTVVGPEAPLAAGIVDRFAEKGLLIAGPTQAAAEIESSKVFAKTLMARYGIPTAAFHVCDSPEAAEARIAEVGAPLVVKADGLAAGKGVLVCASADEARNAVRQIMVDGRFGAAGRRVVIEEFLEGEEATVLAFVDGERVLPMASSQDHKRIGDGDTGPNTGGMGAYSPAPVVSEAVMRRVHDEILVPVVRALAREGRPYRGILYAGLMITAEGPKVIEFNCRFGDPETQALIPRLRTDIVPVLLATARGDLSNVRLEWDPRPCVAVVLASAGYPGPFRTGYPIEGLAPAEKELDGLVFHGGTREEAGRLVTAGGRVLTLAGLGTDIADAVARVYRGVEHVRFEGMTFRRDIAHRALARSG